MAWSAHGHGAIRLHELAIPSSIDRMTAALIAWYIPKSSVLMMSTRASGAKPSNSLERTTGAATTGVDSWSSMAAIVRVLSLRYPPTQQRGDLDSQP